MDTFEKCKAEAIGVNLVAMQFRDILNQIWANLVAKAKKKNTNPKIKTSNLEMKNPLNRLLLVQIIIEDEDKRGILIRNLELLFSLYSKLSETNFGKNPLSRDLEKLVGYYEQW